LIFIFCTGASERRHFASSGGAAFRREHFTAFQLFVGLSLCFVWLVVEAGLVEEFFFRGLAQSHFAAAFKSEVSGIVLMSLIFGLAHAPGFIFRHAGEVEGLGSNPSAIDAIAYSIVVLAVSGITFGIIWARTKNLFVLMLIHAAGDLLPNFGTFVRSGSDTGRHLLVTAPPKMSIRDRADVRCPCRRAPRNIR
jgi:membrane protease YdiL (CAAX protease family)